MRTEIVTVTLPLLGQEGRCQLQCSTRYFRSDEGVSVSFQSLRSLGGKSIRPIYEESTSPHVAHALCFFPDEATSSGGPDPLAYAKNKFLRVRVTLLGTDRSVAFRASDGWPHRGSAGHFRPLLLSLVSSWSIEHAESSSLFGWSRFGLV